MPVTRHAFSSATMTKNKSINNEKQASDSIQPARDPRLGLHLIPSNESGITISLPADETLRELIESFKRPNKDRRHLLDDDLLPAA